MKSLRPLAMGFLGVGAGRRLTIPWMKRPGSAGDNDPGPEGRPPAKRQSFAVPTEYLPLHKYLDNRYAVTVVLTFAEIEDLLGFSLPDPARAGQEWWTNDDPESAPSAQSRSWTEASRTAKPNLLAQTVVFEREAA